MQSFDRSFSTFLCRCALLLACVPMMASAAPIQSMGKTAPTGTIDLSTARPSIENEAMARSLALIVKGDLAGAEASLNESLKLDPALAEAFLALAEIRLRQGKPDEAEAFVRKALAIRPDAPNILVALGHVLLLRKDSAQAEVFYRKALAIDKNHVSAYMGLGELFLRVLNRPREAIAAYSRAVTLNPNLPRAHFALGTAYAVTKQTNEAITAFQAAAKLEPGDPQPSHAVGRIQASQKRLDQAVLSFSAALAANASYLPALVDRADALAELERNREAIADYESALRQRPEDAQLWLKSGLVNERLRHKSDAVKSYKKALSINPDFPLAYNNLAWLAMEEGVNLDQALAWSTKATTLAPKVPQFHDTLGWIYHARGDLEMSRRSLEHAATLTPPQAEVHYHLGIVLQEQGKKKEAETAYRQALRIDRRFGNAGDANKRLGELAK